MEIGVFLLKCKKIIKIIPTRYLYIDNVVSSFDSIFSFSGILFFVNHDFDFIHSILLSFYLLHLFAVIYFFHIRISISLYCIYRYVIHTVTMENTRGITSFRLHVVRLSCNQWVGNIVGSNQLKRIS